MFSLASRAQAVGNTALTASFFVAGFVVVLSLTQLFFSGAWSINTTVISNIRATASLKNSQMFGASQGRPKENSKIAFDLDADLTPLFNWNTKQVFVYLTAEYPGKSDGSSNRVTYWDKILHSREDAVLHLKNARAKYSVWDVEKSFRGRNATLRLEWNVQPWVGALLSGEAVTETESTFQFASKKPKKEQTP